jgi:prepilin-type N-terminal cleavage/methylation domain-containing protein
MRRARGFTLIELLISLALAGMIVAGALQLHVSFNRQSQRQQSVAEIQQTLRVCMLIIEKALRAAGTGIPPQLFYTSTAQSQPQPIQAGVSQGAYVDPGCNATANLYGFQWSNSNTYAYPLASYWTTGNADNDPDWFRIVSANAPGSGGAILQDGHGNHTDLTASTSQNWQDGDLFMVVDPRCGAFTDSKGFHPGCTRVYQVTGGGYQGVAGTFDIQRIPSSCFNPPPGQDECLGPQSGGSKLSNGNDGCAHAGSPVYHFPAGGGTVFRIMTPTDQGNPNASSKLTMRSAPLGTALIDSNFPWTVLAENVEDMQIAIVLNDGTICGSTTSNNSDDPAICNYNNAVAVRITLVGRSASSIPGAPQTVLGGYEDRPTTATTPAYDGYIRRSLTTTVELRGMRP